MTRARSPKTAVAAGRVGEARTETRVEHSAERMSSAGNQTLQRLFASGALRRQAEVGGSNDPEEREADRLAKGGRKSICACGSGSCACKGRPPFPPRARSSQSRTGVSGLDLGSSQPLPPGEREQFESHFHADLSDVRLHDNLNAAAAAVQVNARAFAVGRSIAFARGEYRPSSSEGRLLLGHELAHFVSSHSGIRRITDLELEGKAERAALREEQERAAAQRHATWEGAVKGSFGRDLSSQSRSSAEERQRIDVGLLGQRAAAIDAVAGGDGWLPKALEDSGYSGPSVSEVKKSWADALLSAEVFKAKKEPSSDAQASGLVSISTFYDNLGILAPALEQAHRIHVATANAELAAQYDRRLKEYNRNKELDRMSQGPMGDGESGFRAGQAMVRGAPPATPEYLKEPPSVSTSIEPGRKRLLLAHSVPEWNGVAADINSLGTGMVTLLVATLPKSSPSRQSIEYLEQLQARLEKFEGKHPAATRIPAMFYPKDRTTTLKDQAGNEVVAPQSIPWQFYLINTAVPTREQPARSGGEWILKDLTSPAQFENREPATDFDSARFQKDEGVDPPVSLFNGLNSKIRFPEGVLYLTLPSGRVHTIQTTEPIEFSDFLSGFGLALAVLAMAAAAIATGGAATPAAVAFFSTAAFYTGMGAAAAGIGSTLLGMKERSKQGALTSADVDEAMIQIGLDLVAALSMGLGRVVSTSVAIDRLGARYVVMGRIAQGARTVSAAGDVYQALTVTKGFIDSFDAVNRQPGLTDEERNRMRGNLVRHAFLTGAMLTLAIRGDVKELLSTKTVHISGTDPEGHWVASKGKPQAIETEEAVHPGGGDQEAVPKTSSPVAEPKVSAIVPEPSVPQVPIPPSSSTPAPPWIARSESGGRSGYSRRLNKSTDPVFTELKKHILDPAGKFKEAGGTGFTHDFLIESPDLLQMMHIDSKKAGGKKVVVGSAWINQYDNVTAEGKKGMGVWISNEAVDIHGIPFELRSALYFESLGWFPKGTVASAPRIAL